MPEHDIGLVVLNGMSPGPTGLFFYLYVLNLLLSKHFGLNVGVPAKVQDAYKTAMSDLRKVGRPTRGSERGGALPRLLRGGYQLAPHKRELRVLLGSRIMPLRVLDESYVISGGLLTGNRVVLDRDSDGVPYMELVGLETVRRTVGLD